MTLITETLPAHNIEDTIRDLGLGPDTSTHAPRILMLYGSLRERSFSRFATEEAARVLEHFGCEVRIFDPHGLPVFDRESDDHPKVQELRKASHWSEGQVWASPEQHGSMTACFKNQIDWLPLKDGAVRPTQGRTLSLMQVSGGSQSFNTVNQMRVLGRWMRMYTLPNQSSIAKAWQEFDEQGRMKPSAFRERVIDVMEELFRFTILLRDRSDFLNTRHSEQQELTRKRAAKLTKTAQ